MRFKTDMLKNGKIFSIKFIKNNGELRTMTARLGVTKYLSGGGLKYDPSELNYLIVFSMKDGGYRTVNMHNVLEIKCNGKKYTALTTTV